MKTRPPQCNTPPTEVAFYAKVADASLLAVLAFFLTAIPLYGGYYSAEFSVPNFHELLFSPWDDLGEWADEFDLRRTGLINAFQLTVLLLLPRLVRTLLQFIAWAIFWLLASYAFIYLCFDLPMMRSMNEYGGNLEWPGILVPDFLWHVPVLMTSLFPLALALIASDGMRSVSRFAAGWIPGFLIVWACNGFFALIGNPIESIIAWSIHLALPAAAWLPANRRALQRLLQEERHPHREVALLLLGFLLTLGLMVSAATAFLISEDIRVTQGRYNLPPLPAGATNAKETLLPHFSVSSPRLKVPQEFEQLINYPPPVGELTEDQLKDIDGAVDLFNPYIHALRTALDADLLRMVTEDQKAEINGLNFRTVTRYLRLQVMVDLQRGRHGEARNKIELVLRTADMLNADDSGTSVHHVMAGAIRGVGIGALEDHFRAVRNDDQERRTLLAWMEKNRLRLRVEFPFSRLRHTYITFGPFVTMYSIALPSAMRAVHIHYGRWAHADLIRIAIALEDHHSHHGSYPETLDQLIPAHLDRLPLDPIHARPYPYKRTANGYKLERPDEDRTVPIELVVGDP